MPRALKTPVRFSVGRNLRAAVGSKSDSPKFPDCAVIAATIRASAIALAARKKREGRYGEGRRFPPIPHAGTRYGNTARTAKIMGNPFVCGALFILR